MNFVRNMKTKQTKNDKRDNMYSQIGTHGVTFVYRAVYFVCLLLIFPNVGYLDDSMI